MAKEYGSLNNMLLGTGVNHEDNKPVVGKGATILFWTDRHAYDVTFVSEDGKFCRLESEKHGTKELVFRNNKWKEYHRYVDFTKEMYEKFEEAKKEVGFRSSYDVWKSFIKEEVLEEIYQNYPMPIKVVAGVTCEKKSYGKVNVLFGIKDEYFDLEF